MLVEKLEASEAIEQYGQSGIGDVSPSLLFLSFNISSIFYALIFQTIDCITGTCAAP